MSECLHCGEKSYAANKFCCNGCEAAYEIIHESGLERYYKNRDFDLEEQSLKPRDEEISLEIEPFVKADESGVFSINLMVEGIHCASCVWLVESILNKQAVTVSARVNMSTRRLVLQWKGGVIGGKNLINLVNSLGYKLVPYDAEAMTNEDEKKSHQLLKSIAVSGFAMSNVMLISVSLWSSDAETMGESARALFHWLSMVIAMPAILYAGVPFFRSAIKALREKRSNMDVPISVGVILASAVSLSETINNGEHIYFESAIMLLFFLLIGRYLDIKAKGKAREAAQRMCAMMAGSASILDGETVRMVSVKNIKNDMIIIVASGERIAADGVVIKGESQLDTSLITGESLPENIKIGDNVFAGMINISAPLQIKVTKESEKSLLSDIIKMMEDAEQGQAKYVRLADRVSRFYTPVVHVLAAFSFLMWLFIFDSSVGDATLNAVTVLIITCPCALGLAVPVVQVLASGVLLKKGIFLKSGDALERLSEIDMVSFDKTGTLTNGKPKLLDVESYDADVMRVAASLAAISKHPLSRALSAEYTGEIVELQAKEISGKGIEGKWNGKNVRLGSRTFCSIIDDEENDSSRVEMWLKIEGEKAVWFKFEDLLRDDSAQTIINFESENIDVSLISGDRSSVVAKIARKAGIGRYFSYLSPKNKYDYIERQKKSGHKILMVGDGLNDAPSLCAADVSVSPSSAMDVSQNAADIVFQGNKLQSVFTSYKVAKASRLLINQNFILAFVYNIVAVPVAMAGYVTPLIAAVAMSASSIVVILNAFQIKRL